MDWTHLLASMTGTIDQALLLAQTQHLNHEPQTACNTLSSNELWRKVICFGHREPLTGVR